MSSRNRSSGEDNGHENGTDCERSDSGAIANGCLDGEDQDGGTNEFHRVFWGRHFDDLFLMCWLSLLLMDRRELFRLINNTSLFYSCGTVIKRVRIKVRTPM